MFVLAGNARCVRVHATNSTRQLDDTVTIIHLRHLAAMIRSFMTVGSHTCHQFINPRQSRLTEVHHYSYCQLCVHFGCGWWTHWQLSGHCLVISSCSHWSPAQCNLHSSDSPIQLLLFLLPCARLMAWLNGFKCCAPGLNSIKVAAYLRVL